MWTGTREQYYELYRVAANHLKAEFPEIKVGGYGSCGLYAVNREGMSDFFKGFVPYFTDFLKFVTASETAAPLDFFTWHVYTTDPREIGIHADFVRRTLDAHGLVDVESICDEWNITDWRSPDRYDAMKEMPGATFVAAAFCLMQRGPVDKAMYYDALPQREFCGLYYFPSMRVTKTYHAFRAFNELYVLGTGVECSCDASRDIYACAAKGPDGAGVVLLVNRSATRCCLRLHGAGLGTSPEVRVLDATRTLAPADGIVEGRDIALPPESVVLLRLTASIEFGGAWEAGM
jgi:hypothetical protein